MQTIPIAIEGKVSLLDDFCDIGSAQPASSRTLIERFISNALRPIRQPYPFEGFLRQAIGESIGHELDDILRVEVR